MVSDDILKSLERINRITRPVQDMHSRINRITKPIQDMNNRIQRAVAPINNTLGTINSFSIPDYSAAISGDTFVELRENQKTQTLVKNINSPKDIGELVREHRKEEKITQQQLADFSGVGRRFISELENGKNTLEIGKVLNVCNAIGVDIIGLKR